MATRSSKSSTTATTTTRPRRRAAPSAVAGADGAVDAPRVDLALQGGGSHGAFTWGVLDALLEDGRLGFDGVSGTSAGAMNAAVLACGYARGGREGARAALRAFWADIGGVPGCLGGAHGPAALPAVPSPFLPAWLFNLDQWPLYAWWDAVWKSVSPYQFNPLGVNPLREVLARHVDLAALREGPLAVFVTATAVSTGQPRVFSGAELSIEALLASACLPQMFQAVQIPGELGPDGQPESFWDGGFAGNPALWPLIYGTATSDVLLVQINPLVRPGVPTTVSEINDRLNEITFNASLVAEMRAIAFVQKLIGQGKLDLADYKHLHVHRVADEAGLAPYDASSKLNTDPRLLETLFELGRAAGRRWLAEHLADVGRRSSAPIEQVYLAPRAGAARA